MKDTKARLVADTLAFLRQEGLLKSSYESKKGIAARSAPMRPTVAETSTKPLPKATSVTDKKTTQIAPTAPPLLEAIKCHLPHIDLIEEMPKIQQVALVYEDEEELPFLRGLKKAIEQRFCPCSLITPSETDSATFTCLITPTTCDHPKQIPIESAKAYHQNPEKKRTLWTQICQTLSPKSS